MLRVQDDLGERFMPDALAQHDAAVQRHLRSLITARVTQQINGLAKKIVIKCQDAFRCMAVFSTDIPSSKKNYTDLESAIKLQGFFFLPDTISSQRVEVK